MGLCSLLTMPCLRRCWCRECSSTTPKRWRSCSCASNCSRTRWALSGRPQPRSVHAGRRARGKTDLVAKRKETRVLPPLRTQEVHLRQGVAPQRVSELPRFSPPPPPPLLPSRPHTMMQWRPLFRLAAAAAVVAMAAAAIRATARAAAATAAAAAVGRVWVSGFLPLCVQRGPSSPSQWGGSSPRHKPAPALFPLCLLVRS
mmetsp:Transcript_13921/g.28525  ORF Transcript_13921/g.28525 Transcript_13921/m.28525 type:complete len:201 (+) Transcript_13921:627-1229(+)